MTSLARKIRRSKLGGKTNTVDHIDAENAFHARVARENKFLTHITYRHPTKGYRARSKVGRYLQTLTKAERLQLFWGVVKRAQRAETTRRVKQKLSDAAAATAAQADKAMRTFVRGMGKTHDVA